MFSAWSQKIQGRNQGDLKWEKDSYIGAALNTDWTLG